MAGFQLTLIGRFWVTPVRVLVMNTAGLCLIVQLCLAFGMAGLIWSDKLMPLFDVLMFPWAASYRVIRANSIAAIGLALLLLIRLHSGIH